MIKKPLLASKTTCTGCMACTDICATKALTVVEKEDGHLYIDWSKELCTECGLCTKTCPAVNGFEYFQLHNTSVPYAGWAKNDLLRSKSASGGAFAAIADYCFSQGWYVAGAVQDGFSVKHILTNEVKDLEKLQNSKYQQGFLTGIYKQTKILLNRGNKILFSGTPCQIAALYSYLEGNDNLSNLCTVDLICSGFTSILPLNTFLKNESFQIETISYRNKDKGWVDKDGKIVCQRITAATPNGIKDYGKNFIYSAFFSHLTIRHSCLNCQFAFQFRKADITLADFWGDSDYPNEHNKGINAIICHSDKGNELLLKSQLTYFLTEWNKIISKNYRLVIGKYRFYKYHPTRVLYPVIFKSCSYKFINELFGGKQKNILWLPYRAIGSIIYKLSTIYLKKDLKRKMNMKK